MTGETAKVVGQRLNAFPERVIDPVRLESTISKDWGVWFDHARVVLRRCKLSQLFSG